ncbi:hypothetical protein ACBY42_10790 [Acinetobacter baumannii]|uniref:hypothetical protein n=4 Tax=Acinetobacter baumannii TaxID=470 RepID=UPI00067DEC43|nr:hypothetical protein [Acinetobacter baumannii]AWS01241.1 hypothetical protein CCO27_00260 [Acinetobacter baumannii]KAA8925913.1 hypothetical protein DLI70_12750 [Acinetobacter baumannii]KAA8945208.1 hypothetical protein DLI72_12580 [Acinetobacter baumannii]MCG5934956.1 hypothetical protein [Acinetobacter baumannii]MDI4246899.1 hypothetical protein [Acinetobacter baumannii]
MTGNERIPFESQFKTTEIFKRESAIRKNDILAFSETMNGYFNIVTNDAWQLWNKAKAETVPEGYCLVPKEIPDSVVSCLENSGFHWGDGTRDHYTPIYSLMVEVASESGAEG